MRAPFPLLVAAVVLSGCASAPPFMMPAPTAFRNPRLDLMATAPPDMQSTRLAVGYATTRVPVSPGESGHYGPGDDGAVRLGVASVELGEPDGTWAALVASDRESDVDRPRPARVLDVREIGVVRNEPEFSPVELEFVAQIDALLRVRKNQDLALYVHGYRVNFDEVAALMGGFAHYLGHSAMVTFQWPTGEMFWNYLTDCPRAERYVPDIERLVALLARTRAQHLNLMAYSCGSPLLAEALVRLRNRHPGDGPESLRARYRIGNVIFVASDVDLKTFARAHVPPIQALAQQTIVYVSRKDAALGFSSLIAGASRLGRPSIEDLTPEDIARFATNEGFQAIDVTSVRGPHEMGGMRGHGYWYANDWISNEIVLALRYPLPPGRRALVPAAAGGRIWTIPPDYDERVADALIANYPEVAAKR